MCFTFIINKNHCGRVTVRNKRFVGITMKKKLVKLSMEGYPCTGHTTWSPPWSPTWHGDGAFQISSFTASTGRSCLSDSTTFFRNKQVLLAPLHKKSSFQLSFLKKSLMENFIFCGVHITEPVSTEINFRLQQPPHIFNFLSDIAYGCSKANAGQGVGGRWIPINLSFRWTPFVNENNY